MIWSHRLQLLLPATVVTWMSSCLLSAIERALGRPAGARTDSVVTMCETALLLVVYMPSNKIGKH